MSTDCQKCPLRRKPLFEAMTEEDVRFMQSFKLGELSVEAGRTVLMDGCPSAQFYTVLEGMGLRHKTLADGQRQVISFVLPGDLVGLQAAVMGDMQHAVDAVQPMRLCVFDRNGLWDLLRNQPRRSFALTWAAAVEESFLGEALTALGQRDATQRIAWALSKLYARLTALELGGNGKVPLPYRQQDLADAMGLSVVHTNKVLGRLRAQGLADWSGGMLAVPDPEALAEMAILSPASEPCRPLL